MNILNLASVVKVAAGPLAERLGEEVAILDPTSGLYFGLNEVGTRIWELLQQPSRLEAVADQLVSEYEVEREQCQADVLTLVDRMLEAKLVEVVK